MRETALCGAAYAAGALADAGRRGDEAAEWVAEQVIEPALVQVETGLGISTSRQHDRETIVMA